MSLSSLHRCKFQQLSSCDEAGIEADCDLQEAEREEGQRKTSLVGTADYVAPEVRPSSLRNWR